MEPGRWRLAWKWSPAAQPRSGQEPGLPRVRWPPSRGSGWRWGPSGAEPRLAERYPHLAWLPGPWLPRAHGRGVTARQPGARPTPVRSRRVRSRPRHRSVARPNPGRSGGRRPSRVAWRRSVGQATSVAQVSPARRAGLKPLLLRGDGAQPGVPGRPAKRVAATSRVERWVQSRAERCRGRSEPTNRRRDW